ncbi:MAG: right-handed parallel beta-helix repeat-containing protein, partial [Kiritimatiellae bacterium]|nr:right-handed parallel beta-helix repeat-containing protein [Kiritimatiellia bacterium]
GTDASSPAATLTWLLANNSLTAGDIVYIDTGTYVEPEVLMFGPARSGTPTNVISFIGSTNRAAGGSVLGNRVGISRAGLSVGAASNLVFRNLVFTNANGNAVTVSNALDVVLEGVEARGAKNAGFAVLGKTENVTVQRCAAAGCAIGLSLGECTDVTVDHCVFVDNTVGVSAAANSGAVLGNSALSVSADGAVLYQVTRGRFLADYNGLNAGGNARVAAGADNVRAWQVSSGLDAHSVPGDPLFGDAGVFDYHLMTKRTMGRWMDDGKRTTDEESSPLLVAGRPEADGTRPNIGMYGGTARASLPSAGDWVRAVSFNDAGGVGDETVQLQWVASPAMNNQTVKVEVSVDGGKTWTNVADHVSATGEVVWAIGQMADTPAGLWRVTSETDGSVTDTCDAFFAIRKAPLKIYVAPATVNTNEAAYVTGGGAPDNWQATSSTPLDSLATVLANFDLEGGDTVYIEGGTYSLESGMVMGVKQSGTAANAVRIVGMTNKPFNGATVALASRGYGSVLLNMRRASNVRIEALTLSNAWTGVQAANSTGIEFDRVRLTHMATNAVNAQAGAD